MKSFAKICAVLDALAEAGELTPAEIAARVGEPRPTAYRLLSALAEQAFVETGARKSSYRLGSRLLQLGNIVRRHFDDVRVAALPIMQRLRDASGQTIFLTVRRGFEAVCVERLPGELVQVMILPIGGSLPLHGGAGPRALLAFDDRELWVDFAEYAELHPFTDKTPVSKEALIVELENARERGFVISDEDVIPGIASIAAPVFDHFRVCAALSLSGPRPAVLDGNFERNRDLVCQGVTEISRALGQTSETQPIACAIAFPLKDPDARSW